MVQCSYEQCTREAGHDGPHGYETGSGVVIAPRGDGSLLDEKERIVATLCGSCGGLLSMKRYIGGPGGEFRCTSCPQHYIVLRDGRISSTIATLYPSSTQPGTKLWLQYVEYKCNEWYRDIELRREAGIETPQTEIDEIETARAQAIRDHENALPKTMLERIKKWTGNTK